EKALDVTAETAFKHILIPLDGSDLAERMLSPATALGELVGAQFTLLRVIKPVHPTLPYTEGLSIAQLAGEILDHIEQLQGALRAASPPLRSVPHGSNAPACDPQRPRRLNPRRSRALGEQLCPQRVPRRLTTPIPWLPVAPIRPPTRSEARW